MLSKKTLVWLVSEPMSLLHICSTAFVYDKSLVLQFNVRFLIWFASLQIFNVTNSNYEPGGIMEHDMH